MFFSITEVIIISNWETQKTAQCWLRSWLVSCVNIFIDGYWICARVNRPHSSCCVSLSGIWCSLMCDAGTGEMRPHPGAGLVPHPGRYPLVVCDPNAPLSAVTCIFDFPSQSSGISLEKLTKVRRFPFFQNVSSMFST